MIGYIDMINNLALSLANAYNEVYWDVEIIVNDKNKRLPAVPISDEYVDLSPSDQKQIVYIRRNGDDSVDSELKTGSCVKSYVIRTPIRIVFFADNRSQKDHWIILSELMQSVLIQGIILTRIVRDKWALQRSESSGSYQFGPSTAYFAVDVSMLWNLDPDTCGDDCVTLENPVTANIVV